MTSLTVAGLETLPTWDDAVAKAQRTGIDPATLSTDANGTVYGFDSTVPGGVVILGRLGVPDAVGNSSDQLSNVLPGLFGSVRLPAPDLSIGLGVPWWVWLLLAGGLVLVMRRRR